MAGSTVEKANSAKAVENSGASGDSTAHTSKEDLLWKVSKEKQKEAKNPMNTSDSPAAAGSENLAPSSIVKVIHDFKMFGLILVVSVIIGIYFNNLLHKSLIDLADDTHTKFYQDGDLSSYNSASRGIHSLVERGGKEQTHTEGTKSREESPKFQRGTKKVSDEESSILHNILEGHTGLYPLLRLPFNIGKEYNKRVVATSKLTVAIPSIISITFKEMHTPHEAAIKDDLHVLLGNYQIYRFANKGENSMHLLHGRCIWKKPAEKGVSRSVYISYDHGMKSWLLSNILDISPNKAVAILRQTSPLPFIRREDYEEADPLIDNNFEVDEDEIWQQLSASKEAAWEVSIDTHTRKLLNVLDEKNELQRVPQLQLQSLNPEEFEELELTRVFHVEKIKLHDAIETHAKSNEAEEVGDSNGDADAQEDEDDEVTEKALEEQLDEEAKEAAMLEEEGTESETINSLLRMDSKELEQAYTDNPNFEDEERLLSAKAGKLYFTFGENNIYHTFNNIHVQFRHDEMLNRPIEFIDSEGYLEGAV